MSVVISGSEGINAGAGGFKYLNFGVVGDRRGVKASIVNDSAIISISGVAHLLQDASGVLVSRRNFSLTLNLSTIGVGGMSDKSPLPATIPAWIDIYHIYNPSTNTDSLLGFVTDINKRSSDVLPADMLPQGYTFSALLTPWPVNGVNKIFYRGMLNDRNLGHHVIAGYTSSVPIWEPTDVLATGRTHPNAAVVTMSISTSITSVINTTVGALEVWVSTLYGSTTSPNTGEGHIRGSSPRDLSIMAQVTLPVHSNVGFRLALLAWDSNTVRVTGMSTALYFNSLTF